MRTLALAFALSTLLAGAAARAAPERIAIAVFTMTGQPLAEEAQAKLKASLRGGLAAAGFEVVPDTEVQRAIAESGVAGCDTVSCLRRIGELVMVRRVLRVSIEVLGTSHVASDLALVDLGDGKTAASAHDNCDVCTMKEVNDGLSNAAAALRMQLDATQPGGAPPPPPPASGAPPPAEAPSHRTLYLGLAGVAGGLFVASAVTLAVSAAYHGHASCDASFPKDERCPTRYNGTPGIIIGAIGVPLFGVAAALLAYQGWKSPRRLALLPSIGGGAVALDLHLAW